MDYTPSFILNMILLYNEVFMTNQCKNNNTKIFKNFTITGFFLCASCCSLPIIGTLFGITSLSIIGYYLEKIGIIFIILGMITFIIKILNKKNNSCDINCSCKS